MRGGPPRLLGSVGGPGARNKRVGAVVIVLCGAALAFGLLGPTDDDPSLAARGAGGAGGGGSAARVASCERPRSRSGTCRTERAVLTIVRDHKPLLLPSYHVRVQQARLDEGRLLARARIRNVSSATLDITRRMVYLQVSERKIYPVATDSLRLEPDQVVSQAFAFPVGAGIRRSLTDGTAAELGFVASAAADDGPKRLGVVKLSLES